MNQIKPIRTEADYDTALVEIHSLMDASLETLVNGTRKQS